MSEKVECLRCGGKGLTSYSGRASDGPDMCRDCGGTGFAPTGEGLQEFVCVNLPCGYPRVGQDCPYKDKRACPIYMTAALTAGQMIEICKDASVLTSPKFRMKYLDYPYYDLTIPKFIKYLESRYGGKQKWAKNSQKTKRKYEL